MKDREYRELQLSSSHLVFIFLLVIALGVVIFLLGVSVGKKQAQLTKETEIPSVKQAETIPESRPSIPAEQKPEQQESIDREIASHKKVQEQKKEIPVEKPATAVQENQFYIQVGAYSRKSGAETLAQKFRDRGYPVKILDPLPTDRRSIYRVRVGGYPTRDQAIRIKGELLRLDNRKSSDYFVIQD